MTRTGRCRDYTAEHDADTVVPEQGLSLKETVNVVTEQIRGVIK
jgi:hypothetical protein